MLTFFATTARGMEPLVADEVRAHGAAPDSVRLERGGVSFTGDLSVAYALCLWSRTASRVLLEVARFECPDEEALYDGVRTIDWLQHLGPEGTLAVDFTASRATITHTHFGALKTKDAIVDQLREATGARPSVDTTRPDLRVHVHVEGAHGAAPQEATVSLDLSGESLHRRGYRPEGAAAPLKESLAAAILLFADWPRFAREERPLYDPMCGSGTLLVEAALIARDRAPGLGRPRFGFHGWRGHDEAAQATWRRLVEEANARALAAAARPAPPIVGSDEDRRAVEQAEESVRRAGVAEMVRVERRALAAAGPFATATSATATDGAEAVGLVVANPPYGERLGDVRGLVPTYRQLGDVLRRRFPGWTGAVFTGAKELAREIGLRPSRRVPLYNGPIECRLFVYPIAATAPLSDEGPSWRKDVADDAPASPSDAAAHTGSTASQHDDAALQQGALSPTLRAALPGFRERAAPFVNRLHKNRKHLEKWARREEVHCYRLYDADLPEYAVAVDLYDGAAHVQEWAPPKTVDPERAAARLADVMAVLPEALELPAEAVHLKVRRRQRVVGHEQYERRAAEWYERERPNERTVREGGLRFRVNLVDYVDTGLFLDHRTLRAMIRDEAKGRRVLNLFAYTGSATVYAAAGGAVATTSVDLSNTYLAWAQRNLAENGLDGKQHRLVRADCVAWLDEMAATPQGERERYRVIFLTPPTYSNSKRMEGDLDAARDTARLVRQAARLLEADGAIYLSTHARRLVLDEAALAKDGLVAEEITRKTVPLDFQRSTPRIHRSWRITQRE